MRTSVDKCEILIYSMRLECTTYHPQFDFNVSKFRDPQGNAKLMKLYHDGQHVEVKEWIKIDPRMQGIIDATLLIAYDRLKHGIQKFLSIGFRDFHAKWISRAVAEIVADALSDAGFSVGVIHESLK